ncbi:homoserine kinase [Amycolatopsis aidingensis]|uniref:homoserine kinase n=1 Tax=Amycolatopsis aidingensis TaxID=2842453 RepID=UPI001C0DA991|nr:homoserine kinase [Amycolatopsis aidingensis]
MSDPGFRITVPASSANLGPGFDTFGLALGLHDVVEVQATGSGLEVEVADAGAGDVAAVPTDERHLVVRALRRTCALLGVEVPGLRLRCHNAIPHARGLGSSAAAVVAGIAAGFALAGKEPGGEQDTVLKLAAEFEGHADNAAASLLGGLVLAWCEGERFRARRLDPHPGVRPVLAVPAQRSATDETRGLLPAEVPHADAAFTAGRAALLVHAMTAAPELLLPATEDRLHQGYRAPAYPTTARLIDTLREHGIAATVSGAGPSVLALTADGIIPPTVDVSSFVLTELAVDLVGVRVVAA